MIIYPVIYTNQIFSNNWKNMNNYENEESNNSENKSNDSNAPENANNDVEEEENNSNVTPENDDVVTDEKDNGDDVSMSISLGCNATLVIPLIITAFVYWFLKYQLQRESKIPPLVLILLLIVAAMGAQSASCFLLKSSLAKFSVSSTIGVVVPVFLFLFFYISQ